MFLLVCLLQEQTPDNHGISKVILKNLFNTKHLHLWFKWTENPNYSTILGKERLHIISKVKEAK